MVREADLLFLRSLFRAEDLGAVLVQSLREKIAIITNPLVLTSNARCSLIQILSLLSTSAELAERLHCCNAMKLCHQTIMFISCRHRLCTNSDQLRSCSMDRGKALCNRIGCNRTTNPSNQLAARFSLKLMLHLFFHLPTALDSFKKIYNEEEPIKLVACYSHLTGTMPPVLPNVCYSTPRNQRTKRILSNTTSTMPTVSTNTANTVMNNNSSAGLSSEFHLSDTAQQFHRNSLDSLSSPDRQLGSTCPVDSRVTVSTCSCAPLDHGTFALTGLLRGLIYWRLANQHANAQTVEAVDQFGTHVITSTGLGITGDDIALLVSYLNITNMHKLQFCCNPLFNFKIIKSTIYTNLYVFQCRFCYKAKSVRESLETMNLWATISP
ncbi:unnamed protein product [Trichobilharzia regenti]|nr:unnamed protein product [Trichobilharzia regenti]